MGWYGWRETATRGVLVVGRSYDFSDFTRREVIALCEAIDAIAQRHGAPIVTVPADVDLTDETASDDDPAYCSAFIGVLAAEGGTYEPLPVSRDALLAGLRRAEAIPDAVWSEINDAYRDAGGKNPIQEEIVTRLGCTGALPIAKLAFGQRGPREPALGGVFIHGQDPDQRPHEIGVHGILVASCSYDSSAEPVDTCDEAHEARVAESPRGSYYLIARYD